MGRAKNVTGCTGCEVCGKNSECFEVYLGSVKHIFDSFECAMSAMLPTCAYCRCQIIGEVIQLGNAIFCSYGCANEQYVRDFEKIVIMQEQPHV
jgi:hypothetical protein